MLWWKQESHNERAGLADAIRPKVGWRLIRAEVPPLTYQDSKKRARGRNTSEPLNLVRCGNQRGGNQQLGEWEKNGWLPRAEAEFAADLLGLSCASSDSAAMHAELQGLEAAYCDAL